MSLDKSITHGEDHRKKGREMEKDIKHIFEDVVKDEDVFIAIILCGLFLERDRLTELPERKNGND